MYGLQARATARIGVDDWTRSPILFEYHAGDDITLLGGSFSRASSATYTDADGLIQTAASGVLRGAHYIDWKRYILLEGQRTNLIPSSETLATQTITVSAQTYTLSFYGTGAVEVSGATDTATLTGTAANARVSLTFTADAGDLTLTVTGTCTKGQLEAGNFASSYIPTSGSAVTRAADSLSFPFPYPPQEMTVFVRGVELGTSHGENGPRLWEIGGNTGSIAFRYDGGQARLIVENPAGSDFVPNSTRAPIGAIYESVVSMTGSGLAVSTSINGGAVTSESSSTSLPTSWGENKLCIGKDKGGFSNGFGFFAFRDIIIARGVRDLDWFRSRIAP